MVSNMANLPLKHTNRSGVDRKSRGKNRTEPPSSACLSPCSHSQRCSIPTSLASPGAVGQTRLCVREREIERERERRKRRKGGGERDSEREKTGEVARFVLKSLLCQTCARASAPPPLRCVSALAERHTQPRGEGREAERTPGTARTLNKLHRRTSIQASRVQIHTSSSDLCGARQSLAAWRLR